MSGIVLSTVEARAGCAHWSPSKNTCHLVRNPPTLKIMICADCPLYQTTDSTYEDLYKVNCQATYEWWHSEWLRRGQKYAASRMLDFVSLEESKPVVEEPKPQAPASICAGNPRAHTNLFLIGFTLGVFLSLVLVFIISA